jgi:F-type H+-transporting ATPase subunit gamma
MGAQLRIIRRRVKAVGSIAKVTRAQELIASSRIIQAQQRVTASAPYARQITRAVSALISHNSGIDHAMLRERADATRAAILVITSDRGFCGGYNSAVIREAESLAKMLREDGKEPIPYITGRKGQSWFHFRDRDVAAEWSGFSDRPTHQHAEEIGGRLVEDFTKSEADGGLGEIHVVYTEFVSMLTQRVEVRRLLPLEIEEATEDVAESTGDGPLPLYEFEPDAQTVLDALLPAYVKNRILHMLLQASASEHAARRRAMKSATDNANDLIEILTRQANQARQGEITQEISEIVGGANALADATAGSE